MIGDAVLAIPPAQLAAFVTAGVMLNLAPGQDVMFATACGVQGGPRAGVLAALGITLGVVVYVLALTLGLGAVVAAHPGALAAIRWLGAGYLLWLAWQAWTAPPSRVDRVAERGLSIVRRGLVSNLLNPKPVLFLLSFLPQFTAPAAGPLWQQLLGLGLIFAATGFAITAGYGMLAGWMGARLGARLGILNRLAAVMFAGLAVRMVAR